MIQDNFYYCPIMGLQYFSLQIIYDEPKNFLKEKLLNLSGVSIDAKIDKRIFKTQHKG